MKKFPVNATGLMMGIYIILFLVMIKIAPLTMGALILGVLFSIIMDVPVRLFLKLRLPKRFSYVMSRTLVAIAAIYAFSSFFPVIIQQAKLFFDNVMNFSIPQISSDILEKINDWVAQIALNLINKLVEYIPSILTGIVVVSITAIILGSLKIKIFSKLGYLFPKSGREDAIQFLKSTFVDFTNYVHGQFWVASIVGLLIGLGSKILGIKFALFLGVLAWITDFIPYLGVIMTFIPMTLLAYNSGGVVKALWAIIILVGVNQLEAFFLAPKIQSTQMNLHWFLILISLVLFTELFGVIGILIAIPTLVVIKRYWNHFVLPNLEDM